MALIEATPPSSAASTRREQVLDAAEACFQAHGFHAASMDRIARQAKMSVGQIYRHFDNKEAIVSAIVDRDLSAFRAAMAEQADGRGVGQVILNQLRDMAQGPHARRRCALMLEMKVEASRNPRIAALVAEKDREVELLFTEMMVRGAGPADPAQIARKTRMVLVLVEGTLCRLSRGAASDWDALEPFLAAALDQVLAE